MKLKNKHHYGFTIVELLIVIVVIAILAAISIVAYNGIQTRANNTQTIAAIKDYVKAYGLYALDNGTYPAGGCLGDNYPQPNKWCLSQSGIAECFSIGALSESTGLAMNTALKPYMNNQIPKLSMQRIPCGNTTFVGGYSYLNSVTNQAVVSMLLRGDQQCPPMSPNVTSVSRGYTTDATLCSYTLASAKSI